jgi:hypothetical protein
LDPETAGLVAIHLETCASCIAEFELLAQESQVYQNYDPGIDVAPALWAGVEDRIVEKPQFQAATPWGQWRELQQPGFSNLLALRFGVPALAVLVLSAIVATVTVMKLIERKPPSATANRSEAKSTSAVPDHPDQPPSNQGTGASLNGLEAERRNLQPKRLTEMAGRSAASSHNPAAPRTPTQLVRDAERSYLSAIAMLTRDVQKRPSQLDSKTRARLEEALAAIDRTISVTRKAVRKDPDDPQVVQYMLTAYAKKVDVLKEMTSN